MMKHVFTGIVLSTLFISVNISAVGYYELMEKRLKSFGEKIESVDNVPLVDKLTNLLPFAMVAACLKECPGQTTMVLTGLLVYMFFANDKFRSIVRKYNPFSHIVNRSVKNQPQFDDSLFVFEGDDEEDAQEEEDNDEELLSDEETDISCNKKIVENHTSKFL